jgi:hypothetical protein
MFLLHYAIENRGFILLCNLDHEIKMVGKGFILGIGGDGCVHHGKLVPQS